MYNVKDSPDVYLINKTVIEIDTWIIQKIISRTNENLNYKEYADNLATLIYQQEDYDTSCSESKLDRYIYDVIICV